MNKKLKWIIGILLGIIIILIILKSTGAFGKNEGIPVTTEKAAKRTIIEVVSGSGKIYPETEVKVSSDISGEIVELNVDEGDTVKRGQVLARIYADIYLSQRDQAAAILSQSQAQVANLKAQLGALKATLDQTEATYKRNKTLVEQKVVSPAEFEAAQQAYLSAKANYEAAISNIQAGEANVQSALASLNRASKDVSRTTIVSPVDGVISLMEVKKGERVVGTAQMTGTEMMRIADLSSIEAQVDIGENDIPKVKIGDTAIVEVDAYSQRKFKGVVYKIANPLTTAQTTATTSLSSTSVTNYQVHVRLFPETYNDLIGKGKPFPFRPNMTASADIQTNTHSNVLAVPLNAVTTRDKTDSTAGGNGIEEVVFVLQKDGTVKKYPVVTGIQDISYIEIIKGIQEGYEVVTGPYDVVSKQLTDGMKVKPASKDEVIKGFKK
jgi:HlyD family secretion protein